MEASWFRFWCKPPQQVCADGRHLHQFYVWNGNDAMVPSQFQLNFLPAASLSLATSWLLAECLFFQSDRYHFGEVGWYAVFIQHAALIMFCSGLFDWSQWSWSLPQIFVCFYLVTPQEDLSLEKTIEVVDNLRKGIYPPVGSQLGRKGALPLNGRISPLFSHPTWTKSPRHLRYLLFLHLTAPRQNSWGIPTISKVQGFFWQGFVGAFNVHKYTIKSIFFRIRRFSKYYFFWEQKPPNSGLPLENAFQSAASILAEKVPGTTSLKEPPPGPFCRDLEKI